MKKENKILFGICLGIIFLISVSTSYAYFTASIVNNEVKDQIVETGTLSLRYVDGAEIVMNNVKPGATITKTIYIANTGTLDTMYNLIWQELTNEITKNEIVIEGTCTRINSTTEEEDGTCDSVENTVVSSKVIKNKITIESNIIHKYDLTISFKEMDADQNYNQGKKFSGVLGVKEPSQFEKDTWETIAENIKNGNISNYNLGDIKDVDLGVLGKHYVRIANASTPDECSTEGFSQTACGFVLEFEDIITEHVMNTIGTNVGGWPASAMYTYLNTDLYNEFPTDLKNVIMDTTVISSHGSRDSDNFTSIDKLYLLTPKEIYSDFSSTYDSAKDLTRQLDYYNNIGVSKSNYSGAIKKYGSTAGNWWFRTAYSYIIDSFFFSNNTGYYRESQLAINSYGVSPAFRIG